MPVVHQLRGGLVEAVHPFSAVAVAGGAVVARMGEERASPWRSAAKPFQLRTSLAHLPGEAFSAQELAIGAASHGGEPVHVALVEGLLRRFGLEEDGLRCGAHWPIHHDAGEAVIRAGSAIRQVHSNCSGKHTFMLAAALREGWEPDYRPADHPLQAANLARVRALAGVAPELAVDGCGVPTFHLPISGMARAWSALAEATADGEEGADPMLGRIGRAMMAHPELTSGTARLDLDLARGAREPFIGKIGAAGVFCIALPARRMGLAVKVASGSGEALGAAVEHALARLAPGAFARPERWPWEGVSNVVGRTVGAYRVVE